MAETSSRNHQEFNNTDGGLFLSYTNKNNAKVAAALRRIFPSPGSRRAQSIELIQSGAMEGSILCSTPGVFSIACGEKQKEHSGEIEVLEEYGMLKMVILYYMHPKEE